MGSGNFSSNAYYAYNTSIGRTYDTSTGRVEGQTFTARRLDKDLDPEGVIRECVNSDEHPNTIPVILGLDVTGSMGEACDECVKALGNIMTDLYKQFNDIEFLVMGIGDFAYDDSPLQVSQFESDIRIAEALDKIYLEKGGGGNMYESYTAAWFFGSRQTKLDCFDKQGRKGIIITMGDEQLNPYLPKSPLTRVTGQSVQDNIETPELFKEASEKFHIFHISVDDTHNSYKSSWNKTHSEKIDTSFKEVIGEDNYKISTINALGNTICQCISQAIQGVSTNTNSNEISW